MSNDDYGSLGNEMKAMKAGRASLMAGIKDNRKRIRAEAGQTLTAADRFIAETGKANAKLAHETRQMLAQANRESKARTRQTLADANDLAASIRKDVAALRADAAQILVSAHGFLTQAGADSAKRRCETRKMLARARTESKAQTRHTLAEAGKAVVQARQAVAGIKIETGRVLADATGVMRQLSAASHQRAAGWRNILGMLHGGSRPSAVAVAAHPTHPAGKAAKRTRAAGKKHKRTAG